MKKSQVTIEFFVMIGMSMVVVFGFIFMFSEVYKDVLNEKRDNSFEDYGKSIQIEILTSSQMFEGYVREIKIPEKIDFFSFNISTISNTLVIEYLNGVVTYPIPNTTGDFVYGTNTIKNINGSVCINC